MKLAAFTYAFDPGPKTPIGAGGYLIFISANSPVAPHVCFAIYYDENCKIWHMSSLPCGTSLFSESAQICAQIFSARMADLQEIVEQSFKSE